MRVLVVANPDTPRWRTWARVSATGLDLALTMVPWRDVLDGEVPALSDGSSVVRLDSFGRDHAIARRMLDIAHEADAARFPPGVVSREPGRITPPRQLQFGVSCLLRDLARRVRAVPFVPFHAIDTMFDKTRTRAALAAADVPIPPGLDDLPDEVSVADRIDEAQRRGFGSLYVKLRGGSSACGLVMLRLPRRGPITGLTTVAQVKGAFCNTRRLRARSLAELMPALAFLHREGATWESGVRLLRVDERPVDLRVVVVAGEVVATLGRTASHPITNLHLGGSRVPEARVRAAVPPRSWADALHDAVRAVRAVGATSGGVDVAFDHHDRRARVLEINAFGDFFPRFVDGQGRSLHRAVLEAIASGAVQR